MFKYVLPWKSTCNCYYAHFITLLHPSYKPKGAITTIQEIPKEMICIHLWNEMWRRQGIDKDSSFHKDCFYEKLKKELDV